MLFVPLRPLLRVLGTGKTLTLLLGINAALVAVALATAPLTGLVVVALWNSYVLAGLLLNTAGDLRLARAYLEDEQTIDHTAMEQSFTGLLGQLSQDLLGQQRRQQRVRQYYQDTNSEIGHSSRELETHAEELADNIERQSRSTQSIAAAATEISHSIDEIAGRVASVYESARAVDGLSRDGGALMVQSREVTEEVNRLVRHTAGLLEQLAERNQQVAGISSVIRSLAEQTNLLALNAAIESARAGEHGRGFAVVADEVRNLARRSHESAENIAEHLQASEAQMSAVRDSMTRVSEGAGRSVQQAQETESILGRITERTQSVSDALYAVSSATEQQGTAAREISNQIESVSNVARENSDIALQTRTVAGHLRRLCEEANP